MAFRYTLVIKARGKRPRKVRVTARNESSLKKAGNAFVEPGTEITIVGKTKL